MKRAFVSGVETQLGRRLVEKFGLTKEFDVSGTLSLNGTNTPDADRLPFVTRIVPSYRDDPLAFKAAVLDSDVIICPVHDSFLEAESALKMLSNSAFETEKTFVLVSTVLSWHNTYASQKAEEKAEKDAEREAARKAALEAGEEPPEDEEVDEAAEEEKPVFTEGEYQKRVPHARYQLLKDLEHLTKLCNSETLHTHVVFSGLTYGRGEQQLHDIFRAAWHAQPLPMLTAGANVVPLIHIEDLSNIVFKIGNSSDLISHRYIVATDRGNCSLGSVIKAINDAMGTGETVQIPPLQQVVLPYADNLTTDLRFEPAAAFEIHEESEWICADGIVAGIEKVCDEYRKYRQVQPIRSILIGPPKAGKSLLSKRLVQSYRINHVTVPKAIRRFEEHLDELENKLHAVRKLRAEARRAAEEEERKRNAAELAATGVVEETTERPEGGEADEEAVERSAKKATENEVEDDVSDISFDEVAPQVTRVAEDDIPLLTDEAIGALRPAPGVRDDAEAVPDGDADDDEELNKIKDEIALTKKVLSLKRRTDAAQQATQEDGEAEGERELPESPGAVSQGSLGGEAPPEAPKERFVDEALSFIVRWRLQQKDCLNQGYVLDGFPKTVRQASLTFIAGEISLPELEDIKNAPAEAEVDEAAMVLPVDDKLLPDCVVLLQASEQLLISRADAGVDSDDHDSLKSFYRRYGAYLANHEPKLRPAKSLVSWCKSIVTAREAGPRAMSLCVIDAPTENTLDDVVHSAKEFVGSPRFYRPTAQEIVDAKSAAAAAEAEERARKEAATAAALKAAEEEAARVRREQAIHTRRYTSILEEQAAASAMLSLPMQEYLMTYVVPAVTKGMSYVVKQRPEDPVESLANFLFEFKAHTEL